MEQTHLLEALQMDKNKTLAKLPRCTHKENWAPGQRLCLRCKAKHQDSYRIRQRQQKEVAYDLLQECQKFICGQACAYGSHSKLCRMVTCFLRIFEVRTGKPKRLQNTSDKSGIEKLSIWYRSQEGA
jgi:hypothetical protein